MTDASATTNMDGIARKSVVQPGTLAPPASATDGPTTMNGPLATRVDSLDDRLVSAQFATADAACAARQALLAAGIDSSAIHIIPHAANAPDLLSAVQPADATLFGRLRDAILPDDGEAGARAAIRHDAAILNVQPRRGQVETVVQVIEASNPIRFDANLERWRNAG